MAIFGFNGFGAHPDATNSPVASGDVFTQTIVASTSGRIALRTIDVNAIPSGGVVTPVVGFVILYVVIGPKGSTAPIVADGWPSLKQLADSSFVMKLNTIAPCGNALGRLYSFNTSDIIANSGEQIVVVMSGLFDRTPPAVAFARVASYNFLTVLGDDALAVIPGTLR